MHSLKAGGPPQDAVRIFAAVVIYKISPLKSSTLQSLLLAAEQASSNGFQLGILVWDNTPDGQDPGKIPAAVRYEASLENSGLASAYNRALEIASEEGYDWLLTLDQDTVLPLDFLSRVGEILRQVDNTPAIAAVVPQVTGERGTLSPFWFSRSGRAKYFDRGYVGVPSVPIFAFNSTSILRVSALIQSGGYHPWFWLDSSDHYMFRQLHRHGKFIFVSTDISVAHDFSMMDMQSRVAPERYRNSLLAESAFWDLEMGALAGLERTARLLARAYLHFRRKDSDELRALTHEVVRRRLFWSRGRRLRAWEAEMTALLPHLSGSRFLPYRAEDQSERMPKVSVCMAAYNGEPYLEEQFRSILDQLREGDEVIVVDDKSTDRTPDIIRSFKDDRIRLIEHPVNCGVVATFEEAVRNATGDIIFLADDDDIWAPDKVDKMLEAFREHPEAQIVTTRVSLIDQRGRPSADPIYDNRKTFHSGFWSNIFINHFQGSAMAFRASLLHAILPFPKRVDFLHDHWIGTRNALSGGSVVYIDEPLLLYRRHPRNVSRRLSRVRQVKVRLQSIWTNFYRHLTSPRN